VNFALKGRNYRIPSGMPLTRKEFAPSAPGSKIARFSTGKTRSDYDVKMQLISDMKVQIRHNSLEAARVAINKKMTPIGEENFYLTVKIYPHVIIRENRMISTAGADRLQEGMRKAFGKPMGLAARVDCGSVLFELSLHNANIEKGKEALRTAASKLPLTSSVKVIPLQQIAKTKESI
jgi:large subunit ribosomal protein L10e